MQLQPAQQRATRTADQRVDDGSVESERADEERAQERNEHTNAPAVEWRRFEQTVEHQGTLNRTDLVVHDLAVDHVDFVQLAERDALRRLDEVHE